MIRKILSVSFALFVLIGVAQAEHQTWTFRLDGAQANGGQGTGSEATGLFFMRLAEDNEGNGLLLIDGIHSIENPTASHIHLGARGENGGVTFPFESAVSPIHAEWRISAEQLEVLNAGNYYVNVHTEAFPAGEIRGQIEKTTTDLLEPVTFSFYLQGYQAGMEGAIAGIPLALYTINLGMGREVAGIEWDQGVEGVTAIHIHRGAVGESGPPILTLPTTPEGNMTWFLSEDDVNDLLAGRLYVNIHTEAYPDGVIRGQAIQNFYDYSPTSIMDFDLNGAQANGGQGTGSQATGRFLCLVNEAGNTMTIYGTHNVENATVAHIHRGAPDANGPVVFGFSAGSSPINARWIMTAQDVEDLEAGNLYVNIHSQAFPGGEIRGRIMNARDENADGAAAQIELSGAQANAGNGIETFANGYGIFIMRYDEYPFVYVAGMHTAAFPTMSHIHRGHANENGAVMMPLTLNLTSFSGVYFPSEDDIRDFFDENTYVNVHTTANAGGEIRGNIVVEENAVEPSESATIPAEYSLSAAYPNPFNSSARLVAALPASGVVELSVYDLSGREVGKLVDGMMNAGVHELVWEAGNLPAGTYIAKLSAGSISHSTKLVLVR